MFFCGDTCIVHGIINSTSDPSVVPVARYSACEIAWRRLEQPVVAACGVVPVAAIMTVFPSKVHIYTGAMGEPLEALLVLL